ncbi:MAG: lipase maturation factor family protein [Planctomycetes bacterium]|nr:lipase maturation factor family protein [Planctomycetota bacterium]
MIQLQTIRFAPYAVATQIFLRALAIIYFIAFVSLWTQVDGLVGSQGILPAGDFLSEVAARFGASRFYNLPTLCWLSSSDGFLHALCAGGALLATIAAAAPLSALLWLLLWILYLSLYGVGQVFLGFQWDILLLEAGFLAIFLAPMTALPAANRVHCPTRLAIWLFWWLLFRLMFASGTVKLTWGDPAWQLPAPEALSFHYETQCIPPWTAWYLHNLPPWLHVSSAWIMYFIEIAASACIFLPRRIRLAAGLLQALLQLVIIASGNYGFFNYLTLVLCIPLLDDAFWPGRFFRKWNPAGEAAPQPPKRARPWPLWAQIPIASGLFLLSAVIFLDGIRPGGFPWLAPIREAVYQVQRFSLVSSYGLFRVMTKTRPEIIIEGSSDGKEWKAYEFKYKPGDAARRPVFVAPHQPRLDWQMWFAALGGARQNRWFFALCLRLLEGSKPVLDLLDSNPFPDQPPRYLRARRFDYRFTTFEERRQTGNWWKVTPLDTYVRPIRLEDFGRR